MSTTDQASRDQAALDVAAELRARLGDLTDSEPDEHKQFTADDLKNMTPEQVMAARQSGRLHLLLTGEMPAVIPPTGQLTAEHLTHMTPHQIDAARVAGRLRDLGVGA